MPRTPESIEDEDDDGRDADEDFYIGSDDDSNEDTGSDSADDDTVACPYCRAAMYAGAEQCGRCKKYIEDDALAESGKPRWIIVTAIIILVAFIALLVGR